MHEKGYLKNTYRPYSGRGQLVLTFVDDDYLHMIDFDRHIYYYWVLGESDRDKTPAQLWHTAMDYYDRNFHNTENTYLRMPQYTPDDLPEGTEVIDHA